MTSTTPDRPNSQLAKSVQYAPATLKRAERALRCTPFRLLMFVAMSQRSVALRAIAGGTGFHNGYTKRPIVELAAENDLLWLIQVGLLRREVDGQGLTDSFRLTPLGQQLVEELQRQDNSLPAVPLSDRFYNALSRWLRLPTWLQF